MSDVAARTGRPDIALKRRPCVRGDDYIIWQSEDVE